MDKWKKDDFVKKISEQETQLSFYEKKLRDLVAAYKGLSKEKDSLDTSFKALKNMCELKNSNNEVDSGSDNQSNAKSYGDELGTLMNSLSALSAEKSRMEASFQNDKKLLRQEQDQQEKTIHELREKMKRSSKENAVELEQYKSLLIIEKHEREKEQNNHGVMIRELQQLLLQEKNRNVELRNRCVTQENESVDEKITVNKCAEQIEEAVWLQQLEKERQRATRAEQLLNEHAAAHETRVAGLETRLAELSQTVASHHRLRQQDQNHIVQLKAKLTELNKTNAATGDEAIKTKTNTDISNYVKTLLDKIVEYKTLAIVANERCDKPVDIHGIICDKCVTSNNDLSTIPKDEYTKVLTELEFVRKELNKQTENVHVNNKEETYKMQIKVLQEQSIALNDHVQRTTAKYEDTIELINNRHDAETAKLKEDLKSLADENLSQTICLDRQIRKQRERTVQLLDEKEKELAALKSSIPVLPPDNSDNPRILHYAHELARRDVEIQGLRRNKQQLENALFESRREYQVKAQETEVLKMEIDRLKRSQSREGANMEYLKNVICNYFLTNDSSSKRHMFNAIAAVLMFSDNEIEQIKKHL